jgi:hypothetical protein
VISRLEQGMGKSRALRQAWATDQGWRSILQSCASDLTNGHDRSLNTPDTTGLRKFFMNFAGVDDINASWHWRNADNDAATRRLDAFTDLRCKIAHRRSPRSAVYKNAAKGSVQLVLSLANCTARKAGTELSSWTNIVTVQVTGRSEASMGRRGVRYTVR